ncbi:type VII secretion-associated serine protease mycosin [Actinoplanes sp. NPDC049118]|uniref:type VII secretion-associated serine protease mycosin n=1 Tax=Actinoplanes sp. NPDC049118 TaxID=3155769 RepID=UPI0033DD12C8
MTRRFIAAFATALAGASAAIYGTPALADSTRNSQWHLSYLKVSDAQRISTGRGVTVAVIDSGVSAHPDLSGTVLNGADLFKENGDGHTDLTGHGTSMAGLIAAHGKGGDGALGIAPDAKILPIRILRKGLTPLDFGPAIRFATSHGAKVINISMAGGIDPDDLAAIKQAAEADVVVVAAAGNKSESAGISAPAFLDTVVAVGAVDRKGNKADFSVSGSALDLMAPGEDITSTNNKGGYDVGEGTSHAAAIASGAAALIRSKYPDMSATEVVERLEATAVDKGAPGVDDDYGHGVIDIVAALSGAGSGAIGGTAPPPTTPPARSATPAASPQSEAASSNTPLIVGGTAIVVLLGSLLAFLLSRRRSGSAP